MSQEEVHIAVHAWVQAHPLNPEHIDCSTAVMLKILDGKCKMDASSKLIMAALYHAVKSQTGIKLGADMHRLIAQAGTQPPSELKNVIYEHRVLAETMISRPVMKAFKALLREQGLFDIAEKPIV